MVLGEERRGIKLSYITDTRPIDTIPNFIDESDLFICEGTYGDNEDLEKAIKNYSIIEKKKSSKTTKIIFWLAAIISIIIVYLPNIIAIVNKLLY